MTPEQIKETNLYKGTLPKILKVFPDKAEEYANELAKVSANCNWFKPDAGSITFAFAWSRSPQGFRPWSELCKITGV